MAVKKNTEVVEDLEETDVLEETETTKPTKKATVKLPRLAGQNAVQEEFFSVNFKNYIIKRGVTVEVPIEVAELIENNEKTEEDGLQFIDEHPLNEG